MATLFFRYVLSIGIILGLGLRLEGAHRSF